jgi:hypothetical protein
MLISDLSSTQMMLLVLPIVPNMWALQHCFHRDFPTEKEKYRWMMACVFLPCVGGIAYFLFGRKRASKDKINVFERYAKEKPGVQSADAAVPAAVEAAEPEVIAHPEDPLDYETRARAPWDEEPAETPAKASEETSAGVPAEPSDAKPEEAQPRPEVKDWDFGCPDDVRKNG